MGPYPVLRLDDVTVSRGGDVVWSEGTFSVDEGFVAVIGPNGAGKTTLLQLLLGLLEPSEGTVAVLGERPHRGNPRIGYVPQNYAASNGDALRARDLVLLGMRGTHWGMGAASRADNERVDAALAAVGAGHFATRRMSQLSGGQQQRIAIAQAIVGDPQLLLLDEPLANLDVRNQQEVVGLLATLRRERGLSVVVVTHDLNPLLGHLTSAIYLLDGHAHYATVDAVVDEDLLTHLYGTRVRVVRTAQGDLFTRAE